MTNNTLNAKEIGQLILESHKILIFPHTMVDGDSLGSSIALCHFLREQGKEVFIILEESIPRFLDFLPEEWIFCKENPIENPDLTIAVDCSDEGRLKTRLEWFKLGEKTLCIDHHPTNTYFADFNYVKEQSGSTAELIFDIIETTKLSISEGVAEAIYVGILTDTGNFLYSKTTAKTHEIAAKLINLGVDVNKVTILLYQRVTKEKIWVTAHILNHMKMIQSGKIAYSEISQDTLLTLGGTLEDTEGVVEEMRNIDGVQVSVFFKEIETLEIKVSLRSKDIFDVTQIASEFSGGGHKRAAGCTLYTDLEKAKKKVLKVLENHFNELA